MDKAQIDPEVSERLLQNIHLGRVDKIRALIAEHKIDINKEDASGGIILQRAALSGHVSVVKFLFDECKAELHLQGRDMHTVFHCAVCSGEVEMVRYFVEAHRVDAMVATETKETALHFAASTDNLEITQYLLQECKADPLMKNSQGEIPLHIAIKENFLNLAKKLITACAKSLEFRDPDLFTPFHLAIFHGRLDLIKFMVREYQQNVNYNPKNDDAPLHIAACQGHLDIAKYFIEECKADCNAKNNVGNTPLHVAAHYGHLATVRYLIAEAHADISIKNSLDQSCFDVAWRAGQWDVIDYLIKNCSGFSQKKPSKTDCLHQAASRGEIDTIKRLTNEFKVEIGVTDKKKRTCLHIAASHGQLEMVQFLIETAKLNITTKDADKRTPLHLAVASGHLAVVKHLVVKSNPDSSIKKELAKMVELNHPEIACYLMGKTYTPKKTETPGGQASAVESKPIATEEKLEHKHEASSETMQFIKELVKDHDVNTEFAVRIAPLQTKLPEVYAYLAKAFIDVPAFSQTIWSWLKSSLQEILADHTKTDITKEFNCLAAMLAVLMQKHYFYSKKSYPETDPIKSAYYSVAKTETMKYLRQVDPTCKTEKGNEWPRPLNILPSAEKFILSLQKCLHPREADLSPQQPKPTFSRAGLYNPQFFIPPQVPYRPYYPVEFPSGFHLPAEYFSGHTESLPRNEF